MKSKRDSSVPYITLIIILCTGILSGCFGITKSRTDTEDVRQLYLNKRFSISDLKHGKFTYLQPFVSINQETKRSLFLQVLMDVTEDELTSSTEYVLHPNSAINKINQDNLSEIYMELWNEYEETGILKRHLLKRLGKSLGVKYVLVPIVIDLRETSQDRLTISGFSVSRSSITTLRYQLQVWNSNSGAILWEGYSDLTMVREDIRSDPVELKQTIKRGWQLTLTLLKNEKKISPGRVQTIDQSSTETRQNETSTVTSANASIKSTPISDTPNHSSTTVSERNSEQLDSEGFDPMSYQDLPNLDQLDEFFTIQVQSDTTPRRARRLSEQLQKLGHPATVRQTTIDEQHWYRVRIGVFRTRSRADSYALKMKNEGDINSYWISKVLLN